MECTIFALYKILLLTLQLNEEWMNVSSEKLMVQGVRLFRAPAQNNYDDCKGDCVIHYTNEWHCQVLPQCQSLGYVLYINHIT
jgi:hypothetical protein